MEKDSDRLPAGRLLSLDTLRGVDMFFIMGAGYLFDSLARLFPESFWSGVAAQFRHVPWNGLAFIDIVFPLFLFIAGISFPFSLASSRRKGFSERKIQFNIIRRGVLLVLLGMIYNGLLQLDFDQMRYASVLGRIGLAWMFAALIWLYTRPRTRVVLSVAILLGYWLLLAFVPAPDGTGDPFSREGCLVGYVDRICLPGTDTFDPEGILSTLPAIVTALLGMFAGAFVRSGKWNAVPGRKALALVGAGILLIGVGVLWNTVFPINKRLWSSSFVCTVGGISAVAFALFHYVVDVCGHVRWTLPFRVIGMNSITIYLAQSMIDFGFTARFLFGGIIGLPENAEAGNVLYALAYIAVCWIFLGLLYRWRIFLKV